MEKVVELDFSASREKEEVLEYFVLEETLVRTKEEFCLLREFDLFMVKKT